ncbi:probable starch synthase 4, chloroplastic/amyloplastic isoform X1 [Cucurbita pepo subsp. pepo]|uniref:probable starch synthase 4, chloroplastic/amyloplastic isoform X1 n=2 Tax=Cucurbita pepo subsp. pepo TaxID=3664 RepID=UPI000C9D2936|nr:probable starch synthase 4, chloroplastic/amyloplastic isoform X1 [Cucurbita pepo subsp. pepo]
MAIHAFTTTGFSFHLPFPKCTTAYSRSAGDRARTLCCSSGDGDLSGLINVSSESEFGRRGGAQMAKSSDGKRSIQSSDGELRAKNSEIWQLFREAQRNILSLDKQRALAVEELNKAISEKKLLLERIEELEIEKQAMARKDQVSLCWELLLRIDSMVLTGTISFGEASQMRQLIMDQKVSILDAFTEILQKKDAELLAELRQLSDRKNKNGFHIVHICTEMAPIASFGAVASFVTGLSQALQRKGNLVEVILPKYGSMDLNEVQGIRETEVEYYSYYNGQLHGNKIWTGVICGIGVTFIQPLYYSSFFNREKAYGYSDDFERFMYFSRAALDYIVKSGKKPDVLHIHNWQTAIIGPLFWDIFVQQGLEGSRILFTCHDIHSQPLIQPEKLALCGLDPTKLHRPDRLQDNSNTHLANIMKGGIVYSNKVVIMSSTHSKGHIIHSSSHGLETTLNMHKDKLLVSPCGFESSSWDPEKDKILPENYSADDMKGKSVCKIALQQKLRLPENASIITVGCFLSDLSDVDKEDLIAIVKNGTRMAVQFIFMTTGKMKSGQKELESLQVKIESLQDENIRFINRHDETLSHLIFGGSNIILCQSLHDPILQVPLKAMRYGAAPIAITSNDNGFRHFPDHDYETTKLAMFINSTFGYLSFSQALDEINNNPSEWNHKVFDAMTKDFSWDAECCDIYLSAYTAIKSL